MKKITILVLHLGYGGIEKYVASLCKMLDTEYEIEIVSTYRVGEVPAFPFSSRVKIKYLLEMKPNGEEFKQCLKKKDFLGILREGFKAVKILFLKRQCNKKYLKNLDCDYIITTRGFHSQLVSKYAKKGIITIGTEHNYHNDDEKYIKNFLKASEGLDYLVVVSQSLKDFYKSRVGKKAPQVVYIPNVQDELPKERSPLDTFNIISIGRLVPEKGFAELLEVFALVKKEVPESELYILGDGPLKESIERQGEELGLGESINLPGFVKGEDLDNYFRKSSVYVMTSLTESFGLVLLEAMSYGLPCIAFDTADGPRFLLAEDRGILIKERDKEKMVLEIKNLLLNKEEAHTLGDRGYEYCQRYLGKNVKKDWIELLEKGGQQ